MSKNVYQLIAAVSGEISQRGIAKAQTAQAGRGGTYAYRGIDDVYNSIGPIMARHGLVVVPNCVDRSVSERQSANGGTLFCVVVRVEFSFVSAHDGSTHKTQFFGEAFDSGDKATNKAMSAAYKYAALQTFCIPTEGDNDPDAVNHEVAPQREEGISWAEVNEIEVLAGKAGVEIPTITAHFGVSKLDEIPKSRAGQILRSLQKKMGGANA